MLENVTIIDEAQVREAWNRNAPLWTDRVRAGMDLYRELLNNPAFMAFLPDISGKEVVDLNGGGRALGLGALERPT
mgnify:CR=1 FL=1